MINILLKPIQMVLAPEAILWKFKLCRLWKKFKNIELV